MNQRDTRNLNVTTNVVIQFRPTSRYSGVPFINVVSSGPYPRVPPIVKTATNLHSSG